DSGHVEDAERAADLRDGNQGESSRAETTKDENEPEATEEVGEQVWNRRSICSDPRGDAEKKTEYESSDLINSISRIALIEKKGEKPSSSPIEGSVE
ncbi:MAG: hypothetical protein P1Q69_12270, partial [Candidatus Thorarchaeota archaeon]|nr:hypothetical protein [Candidatus Thorarchaeota archaeon]